MSCKFVHSESAAVNYFITNKVIRLLIKMFAKRIVVSDKLGADCRKSNLHLLL